MSIQTLVPETDTVNAEDELFVEELCLCPLCEGFTE